MHFTPFFSRLLAFLLLAPFVLKAEIETWTNLDGVQMQAEYLGRKGDYVTFKKDDGSRYIYPHAKLSEQDRARIDALPLTAPPEDSVAAPASSPAISVGKIPAALAGKLVHTKGSLLVTLPRDQLAGTRYLAFYYSAKWCPPCRAFTPELVSTYNEIKAKHPEFELIFVSSDKDENAMQDYMKTYNMTWPALRFGEISVMRLLARPEYERGIPNLVFMDAEGKEISVSYTPNGQYRGPRAVLSAIKKHFEM